MSAPASIGASDDAGTGAGAACRSLIVMGIQAAEEYQGGRQDQAGEQRSLTRRLAPTDLSRNRTATEEGWASPVALPDSRDESCRPGLPAFLAFPVHKLLATA